MLQQLITESLRDYFFTVALPQAVDFRSQEDDHASTALMMVFKVGSEQYTHRKIASLSVEWDLSYSPDDLSPEDFEVLSCAIDAQVLPAWVAVEADLIAKGMQGLSRWTLDNKEQLDVSQRVRSYMWTWSVGVVTKSSSASC